MNALQTCNEYIELLWVFYNLVNYKNRKKVIDKSYNKYWRADSIQVNNFGMKKT